MKYNHSIVTIGMVFVLLGSIGGTPTLSIDPENRYTGTTLTFTCEQPGFTSQSMFFTKGSTIIYNCLFGGSPCDDAASIPDYSHIDWSQSDRGIFTISNADQSRDSGNWTCFVGGWGASDGVVLQITDPPLVSLEANPTQVKTYDTLSLTCRLERNISIASVRFTRNGALTVYITLTSSSDCNYISRGSDGNTYSYSCDQAARWYQVDIVGVRETEHGAVWRCEMSSLSPGPGSCGAYTGVSNPCISSDVSVFVVVPITGISLINPAVGTDNTVILTENVPTTFQCRTTKGRPAANVTWYLDNVLQSGGTTSTAPVTGDSVTTTGTLTLTLDRTADGKVLSCRGTNYVNMVPVQSTRNPVIRVMYAPAGPPHIVGFGNGTMYRAVLGRPQSLTCQVPTAYPVPTLSWSCPSYTATGTTPGATDGVSSTITWTATSTEPGQACQCTSHQEVSGNLTSHIYIDVLYTPRLTLTAENVTENSTATLRCTADGVPASYEFDNWTHVAPDNKTVLRSLTGISVGATNTLTLSDVGFGDSGFYTCTVSNGVNDYTTGETKSSAGIILIVRSRPVVTEKKDFSGRKGESVTLSLKFYSNTAFVPGVYWKRLRNERFQNVSSLRFNSNLAREEVVLNMHRKDVRLPGYVVSLSVRDIAEDDFTVYRCVIWNDIGQTASNMTLSLADTDNFHLAPVLGGLAAGLVVVALLALVVVYCRRRAKDNQRNSGNSEGESARTDIYQDLSRQRIAAELSPYQDLESIASSRPAEYVNLGITS